jgi:hypothetical protein
MEVVKVVVEAAEVGTAVDLTRFLCKCWAKMLEAQEAIVRSLPDITMQRSC